MWVDMRGNEYEGTPLDLIDRAVDSRATDFFAKTFPEEFANDPIVLYQLVVNIIMSPPNDVIALLGIFRALFNGGASDGGFRWSGEYFAERNVCDLDFLKEVLHQVGLSSRETIATIQKFLANYYV